MGKSLLILRLSEEDERKLRVTHSLTQHISQSTIDEICKNAGISKRTFYSLFKSKYEMSIWYKNFFKVRTVDKIGEEFTWEEGYERLFALMDEEREFILKSANIQYLGSPSTPDSVVEMENWAVGRIDNLQTSLVKRGIDPADSIMSYCVAMLPYIESRAIRNWLYNSQEDSALVAKKLTECVPKMLYDAIKVEHH